MHATPSPRVDPLVPMSRVDMLELIERATKLGDKSSGSDRSTTCDRSAAERVLQNIRSGALNAVDVFRGVVTSASSGQAFNIRVLHFIHWLCLSGGPTVLAGALHTSHPRRPCAGLRIVLEILRSLGHENAEDLLYNDSFVRDMSLQPENTISELSSLNPAVEAYAITLGRKFIFHQRFPDIEFNYSLDRFYRSLHIENDVDAIRRNFNDERHAIIISHAALADISIIARVGTVALEQINAGILPPDVFALVLGEASNAISFTKYLQLKTGSSDSDHDVSNEQKVVARRLRKAVDNGGVEARLIRRYVDGNVFRAITEVDSKPCRPESRHRREIRCHFSSFEAMHRALKPPSIGRRDR